MIVCLLLAVISWRFVETPFRRMDKVSRYQLVRSLGSSCVVLVIFVVMVKLGSLQGMVASVTNVAPYPICRQQRKLFQNGRWCHNRSVHDACNFISGSGKQHYYLVGDSSAGWAMPYPLWQHLKDRDARLTVLTKGACPFAPPLATAGKCTRTYSIQRRKILLESRPGIIILQSLLHIYVHGSRNRPHLDQSTSWLKISNGLTASMDDIRLHTYRAVEELLEHGHTVVLVYPIHMADFDVGKRLTELEQIPPNKRKNLLMSDRFTKSYQEFRAFADVAYQIYDSIEDHHNLIRILPEDLFCDSSKYGRCEIFDQGDSLYRNFSHLSYYGASKLVSDIFVKLP